MLEKIIMSRAPKVIRKIASALLYMNIKYRKIVVLKIRTWPVWFNPFYSPSLHGMEKGKKIVEDWAKGISDAEKYLENYMKGECDAKNTD